MLWDRWTFVQSFLSTSLGFTKASFSLYRVGRVGALLQSYSPRVKHHPPLHHTGWMDGWMDGWMMCGQKTLFHCVFYPIS